MRLSLPQSKEEGSKVDKSRKGDLLIMRFSDGEDLLAVMKQALLDENVKSGIVLGGVGMVRNAGLSFYKGRGEYETVPVATESELCSLNGNVSRFGDDIIIHLHAVIGRPGGDALAGHLSAATVNMTAEVAVLVSQVELVRKQDPETGLKTLGFGQGG